MQLLFILNLYIYYFTFVGRSIATRGVGGPTGEVASAGTKSLSQLTESMSTTKSLPVYAAAASITPTLRGMDIDMDCYKTTYNNTPEISNTVLKAQSNSSQDI